ncbi:trypsin-like serine peptidase [Nocardioides pyridinolyticus]
MSGYTPLVGARVVRLTLRAGLPQQVRVTGRAGVPASGVLAVALEVTASGAARPGSLRVQSPETGEPRAAAVRYPRRSAATALATAKLDDRGRVVLTSTRTVTVRVDAVGWYEEFAFLAGSPATGSQFHAIDPALLASTAGGRRLGAGAGLTVQATGRAGIPRTDVTAVAVSITASRPTGPGSLLARPAGAAAGTQVLSYAAGNETQLALVKLGTGGRFTLRAGRATHVRVVAVGYFQRPGDDIVTGQSSLIPAESLFSGRLSDGDVQVVGTAGAGRIPDVGVQSLLVNVTVTGASRPGRVALYRAGDPATTVGAISYRAGETSNAMAVAPVAFEDGRFVVRNLGGDARVTVTAVGWHAWVIPPPPTPPGPPPGDRTGKVAPPPGHDKQVVHLTQNPSKVREFWTRARLARARAHPVPLPGLPGLPGATRDDPSLVYPAYDSYQSDYLPAGSYDARVGRLYMSNAQSVGSCSATLVARNLLITAAHCVSGMTNFVWEAGQVGGQTSGTWVASGADYYVAYDQGWAPLDYAVVVLPPTSQGYYAGDYHGWFAIYAGTANAPVLQEGYPAEGWFTGNCPSYGAAGYPSCYAYYNYSAIFNYYDHQGSGWYEYAIGGYTNGGASGGPFFQYINGQWYVTGVVSHGDNTIVSCADAGVFGCTRWFGRNTWSPYFNQWVIDLWRTYAVV